MPRISKTIIPRIKQSLRNRGLATSIFRSVLLPVHLFREYRAARAQRPDSLIDEFDQRHGVDTEGKFGGWIYLSDLDIPSSNWFDGNDYAAIEPARFRKVMACLPIAFDEYTFIDFGSGKGRALLLASEFPFKRIIGLEFSPELHGNAEENITRYRAYGADVSNSQKCRDIRSVNTDFLDYSIPSEPSVLFFFHPCKARMLSRVMDRIGQSLRSAPRPLYIVYVAATQAEEKLLSSTEFLKEVFRSAEFNFCIYESCP
jgi:hypothetical protein